MSGGIVAGGRKGVLATRFYPSAQTCHATAIRRACPGGTHSAFRSRTRRWAVYSILYIIGAIVVIIVVLRLLGLY
jgi:hypothetical protein